MTVFLERVFARRASRIAIANVWVGILWAAITPGEVAAQEEARPEAAIEEPVAEQVARRFVEAQAQIEALAGRFQQSRRLRNVRRPIETEGRFWFDRKGRFRWQVEGDEGIRLLALREADGGVLLVRPEQGEAKRVPPERAMESAGGLVLMQPGNNSDWEQFNEVFRVAGGKIDPRTGLYLLELRLRDRRAATAVYRVVFHVKHREGKLLAFELFFRDNSSIFTRFFDTERNPALGSKLFQFDLTGYEVQEAE